MDIKKDKKGLVYVQGSIIKEASNSKELFALFEEGSKNRHTASTSKLGIQICQLGTFYFPHTERFFWSLFVCVYKYNHAQLCVICLS